MATCSGKKTRKEFAPGCKITRLPKDEGCQHQRRIAHMALPGLPCIYRVFAHHDCTHNQLTAIHNRVCGRVPEPEGSRLENLLRTAKRIGKSLGYVAPITLDQFVDHYTGAKRERYREAAEQYRRNGISKRDAAVKMFIKLEKIRFKEFPRGHKKNNPDPRAIQFRDPVFSAVFATYLKPIEYRLYTMRGNRLNGLPPSRVIGKGLNQGERASLLKTKMQRFQKPVIISLDMSRFDQHVSKGLLQVEHNVYRQCNSDPEFMRLCSWQLVNHVTTTKGIKYVTLGKRMSGDMNTACGNCVIVVVIVANFFETRNEKWDLLDDGDDMLLIVEQEDASRIESDIIKHFLECGMEADVEGIARNICDVNWCQSKVVYRDLDEPMFIRDPAKVMSGALAGPKWQNAPTLAYRQKLCYTIGLCELILNKGIPVLQSYAAALMRNAGTTKTTSIDQTEQLYYRVKAELRKTRLVSLPRTSPAPITTIARETFERAFGVSIDEQLAWESYLDTWKFSLQTPLPMPSPINVPDWTWESEDLEWYGGGEPIASGC